MFLGTSHPLLVVKTKNFKAMLNYACMDFINYIFYKTL